MNVSRRDGNSTDKVSLFVDTEESFGVYSSQSRRGQLCSGEQYSSAVGGGLFFFCQLSMWGVKAYYTLWPDVFFFSS